jgi:NTE family protein
MDPPLPGMSTGPTSPSAPADAQRVLVLQGGGALGSYQAGAYQALCHHDFEPEWIAGISIGAINAAIIAGNDREKRIGRLKEFWETVSSASPMVWSPLVQGDRARSVFNETSAAIVATFGVPGFFRPRLPPAPLWPTGSPQSQSYYDTEPLRATLERLVDFDRINDLKTRLSIGAVSVTTGNFRYFDNYEFKQQNKRIGPEHIMASGALPPGFPSIEIEGEHYWDGGIVSNTPLDYVLEQERNNNLLIFQVDLFSARGLLPQNLVEAAEREKDIRYSSRTRMNTDMNRRIHNAKRAIQELIAKLPDDLKTDPLVVTLNQISRENTVTVVHLIYRSKTHEASSKDYDFSRIAMTEHWAAGERDVYLSMRHPDWLARPQSDETMVAYDLSQEGSENIKGPIHQMTGTQNDNTLNGPDRSGE